MGTFRNEIRENQYFSDDIQMSISLINHELQNLIDKLMNRNDHEEPYFGFNSEGIDKILTIKPLKKSKKTAQIPNIFNIWWIKEVGFIHMESCIHLQQGK